MSGIRHVGAWSKASQTDGYDCYICALGYESRSIHAASYVGEVSEKRIAVGFDYHHCGALESNRSWFEARGYLEWLQSDSFDSPFLTDEQFSEFARQVMGLLTESPPNRPLRLCIDISCFSTVRLALLLEAIDEYPSKLGTHVDFVYAAGKGYDANQEPTQIEIAGPVTIRYAGWTVEPDMPVHAVFGLGLEYEKAVGAFELLNPSDAFAFATLGTSASLDKHLTDANRLFFPLIDTQKRFSFRIDRTLELYHRVQSLVHGILREARPVLVPMGPKIFTLVSLLIAEAQIPRVSVWRISTGRSGEPIDIEPTGPISGLSVEFEGAERVD